MWCGFKMYQKKESPKSRDGLICLCCLLLILDYSCVFKDEDNLTAWGLLNRAAIETFAERPGDGWFRCDIAWWIHGLVFHVFCWSFAVYLYLFAANCIHIRIMKFMSPLWENSFFQWNRTNSPQTLAMRRGKKKYASRSSSRTVTGDFLRMPKLVPQNAQSSGPKAELLRRLGGERRRFGRAVSKSCRRCVSHKGAGWWQQLVTVAFFTARIEIIWDDCYWWEDYFVCNFRWNNLTN